MNKKQRKHEEDELEKQQEAEQQERDAKLQGKTGKEVEASQKIEKFTLRADEVEKAIQWEKTSAAASFGEIFSTHPRAYKRIEALDELEKDIRSGRATIENV